MGFETIKQLYCSFNLTVEQIGSLSMVPREIVASIIERMETTKDCGCQADL